jgi:hypothetical protein
MLCELAAFTTQHHSFLCSERCDDRAFSYVPGIYGYRRLLRYQSGRPGPIHIGCSTNLADSSLSDRVQRTCDKLIHSGGYLLERRTESVCARTDKLRKLESVAQMSAQSKLRARECLSRRALTGDGRSGKQGTTNCEHFEYIHSLR